MLDTCFPQAPHQAQTLLPACMVWYLLVWKREAVVVYELKKPTKNPDLGVRVFSQLSH